MGFSAGNPEQENGYRRSQSQRPLQEMRPKGGGLARQALALPLSPLELKTGSGGAGSSVPSSCWWHKHRLTTNLSNGGLGVRKRALQSRQQRCTVHTDTDTYTDTDGLWYGADLYR